ncbi:hypothetical protein EIN_396410, partial [Entamoeba invadens IP1]
MNKIQLEVNSINLATASEEILTSTIFFYSGYGTLSSVLGYSIVAIDIPKCRIIEQLSVFLTNKVIYANLKNRLSQFVKKHCLTSNCYIINFTYVTNETTTSAFIEQSLSKLPNQPILVTQQKFAIFVENKNRNLVHPLQAIYNSKITKAVIDTNDVAKSLIISTSIFFESLFKLKVVPKALIVPNTINAVPAVVLPDTAVLLIPTYTKEDSSVTYAVLKVVNKELIILRFPTEDVTGFNYLNDAKQLGATHIFTYKRKNNKKAIEVANNNEWIQLINKKSIDNTMFNMGGVVFDYNKRIEELITEMEIPETFHDVTKALLYLVLIFQLTIFTDQQADYQISQNEILIKNWANQLKQSKKTLSTNYTLQAICQICSDRLNPVIALA